MTMLWYNVIGNYCVMKNKRRFFGWWWLMFDVYHVRNGTDHRLPRLSPSCLSFLLCTTSMYVTAGTQMNCTWDDQLARGGDSITNNIKSPITWNTTTDRVLHQKKWGWRGLSHPASLTVHCTHKIRCNVLKK